MKLEQGSLITQDKFTIGLLGKMEARIKMICDQKKLLCETIKGFNTSSYNHFTQQNDLFTNLNERLVIFNKDNNLYNEEVRDYVETFGIVEDLKGNKYLLQRDLYAAAKLLYLYPVEVEKETKSREKYITTEYKIDQEGFEKFFSEKFYPAHIKYIKQLIKDKNLNININETILGW